MKSNMIRFNVIERVEFDQVDFNCKLQFVQIKSYLKLWRCGTFHDTFFISSTFIFVYKQMYVYLFLRRARRQWRREIRLGHQVPMRAWSNYPMPATSRVSATSRVLATSRVSVTSRDSATNRVFGNEPSSGNKPSFGSKLSFGNRPL